jgi:hypothetical protein
MRGSLRRLGASVLIALLALPLAAAALPSVAPEQPAPSAPAHGMTAIPAHAAVAEVAIASTGVAPLPASAVGSVLVCFRPVASRTTTNRPCRPSVAVKAAPTVLRV